MEPWASLPSSPVAKLSLTCRLCTWGVSQNQNPCSSWDLAVWWYLNTWHIKVLLWHFRTYIVYSLTWGLLFVNKECSLLHTQLCVVGVLLVSLSTYHSQPLEYVTSQECPCSPTSVLMCWLRSWSWPRIVCWWPVFSVESGFGDSVE